MAGRLYRSRQHEPLRHLLVDMLIGTAIGIPLAIVAWLLTVLIWAAYGR